MHYVPGLIEVNIKLEVLENMQRHTDEKFPRRIKSSINVKCYCLYILVHAPIIVGNSLNLKTFA